MNKEKDGKVIRGEPFLTEQIEQIFHQGDCKLPLNYIGIKAHYKRPHPVAEFRPGLYWSFTLPDSPMPKNIEDFRLIKLRFAFNIWLGNMGKVLPNKFGHTKIFNSKIRHQKIALNWHMNFISFGSLSV
jgi:hypothetical protein